MRARFFWNMHTCALYTTCMYAHSRACHACVYCAVVAVPLPPSVVHPQQYFAVAIELLRILERFFCMCLDDAPMRRIHFMCVRIVCMYALMAIGLFAI